MSTGGNNSPSCLRYRAYSDYRNKRDKMNKSQFELVVSSFPPSRGISGLTE